MDADCICTLSTGPGLAALGVEPGQLVGLNLLEVYSSDQHAQESLRRVLSGETFSTETPFRGRMLSVFYQPTWGPDGEVTGAIGVSTDVTEQRRIEAEVQGARERETLLSDLSAVLNREVLDLRSLSRQVARSVVEALGSASVLWLHDPTSPLLRPRDAWGFPDDVVEVLLSLPDDAIPVDYYLEELGAQGDPRVIDLRAEGVHEGTQGELAADIVTAGDLHSTLRAPLRSRGVLVGALDILRGADLPPFTERDVSLAMEIAERCALALDNALLLDAERAAREDLLKFKALADASTDLIAISSPEGQALYINPRVYEVGIEPVLDDLWTTVSDQVGTEVSQEISLALTATGRWSGDLRLEEIGLVVRADVFALQHPVTDVLLGTAWIAQDVSELRNTERALRQAVVDLKRFKALVEASPDFIAIADLDGTVRYVNPRGRAMIGMGASVDVTTTTLADYLTAEGLVASVQVQQPAVVVDGQWTGESTLRDWRDDSAIPVAVTSFLMRDMETGVPIGLATVQRDITERLATETALRRLADERQNLLSRLVDAQDEERRRIAADVHDDPVQALAAVDLRLGLLRRRVREQAPALVDALDALQDSVSGATDRLRALLFDLDPTDLERGLGEALRRCADDVLDGSGVHWDVDATGEPDSHQSTRAVAYRIGREALINVRKHAEAARVRVEVGSADDGLLLTVTDDGVGLDPAVPSQPGHRGIATMADRAAAAGGTCAATPGAHRGTVVTVWLPLG
ncbi:MAG: PAS domain-containing protein [Actinomycetes bacterium]